MSWQPISAEGLAAEIEQGLANMSAEQRRLWDAIAIPPQKWALPKWGDLGGGFWVVAIYGKTVVWFNDIELGFNRSPYVQYGEIEEYWCNQDELQWTIQRVLEELRAGQVGGALLGPPETPG